MTSAASSGSTAQALVGHSSATTAKYDRRPERTRRPAVDKLATADAVPLPGAEAIQGERRTA
ncbi:hypothetical protein ACIBQ1_59880 [Nonomuraea sp. NPDC050153]|uniref:hypothetical protein n=1 Tax=Nonomuraea sp. NPDC050153 TaxID=3364359 RepID=UPI0037A61B19